MKTTMVDDRVAMVVKWLEQRGSQRGRDGMARYGLPSDRAFGVAASA